MRCVTAVQVHCALQRPDSAVVSFQTDGVVHLGAQLREAEQWRGGPGAVLAATELPAHGSGCRTAGLCVPVRGNRLILVKSAWWERRRRCHCQDPFLLLGAVSKVELISGAIPHAEN